MNDQKTTLQDLKDITNTFVTERDWRQFHNPKNLSMNIAIEAGELMEKFLWVASSEARVEVDKDRTAIEEELVDVMMGVLAFANASNVDITSAFLKKMEKNRAKYPIEKARGVYTKHTKL